MKRCASTVTLAVLTIVATSATVAKGAEQEVPNGERPASLEAVVTIDADAPSVPYSRMLFGGFLEHFHHQIYGGIFEPGSPLSDERGFART